MEHLVLYSELIFTFSSFVVYEIQSIFSLEFSLELCVSKGSQTSFFTHICPFPRFFEFVSKVRISHFIAENGAF